MATLEVNKHETNFDSNKYLNLKSLLPQLQRNYPLGSYSIGEFLINGSHVDINSEDPLLIRPISEQDHIKITFNKSSPLLQDIIEQFPMLLERIISTILICTDHLKEDNFEEARYHLSKSVDGVNTFIESISYTIQNIPNEDERISTLPIKELQIHLLSVMKAVNSANHKEDTIMLTDLLEYELKDNLTQWKILIIPVLKQSMKA